MKFLPTSACVALIALTAAAPAATLVGGLTSVALDADTLSTAAGLDLSGVSTGIESGSLPNSVAFPINSRTSTLRPTTFEFTAGDFPTGAFSGTIEHTGSVFFNGDTVEVGNFSIAFDAARATGGNSGFFVESTTGVEAILFDTQVVALDDASLENFDLTVDLVVSPEFATFLGDTALTGADVGDANIQANAVPEPSFSVLALASGGLLLVRRRQRG
jgi:hypothetical protein